MTSYPPNVEMEGIDDGNSRGRQAFSSKCSSRESSISSTTSSIPYSMRMELNNDLPEEVLTDPIDSSQLSYVGTAKVSDSVSLATDKEMASTSQRVDNEVPALKKVPKLHGKGKGKDKQIEDDNPTQSDPAGKGKGVSVNVNNSDSIQKDIINI